MKIGVFVIVVLLIVLGGVVTAKVRQWLRGTPQPVAETGPSDERENPASREPQPAASRSTKPTVLAALPGSAESGKKAKAGDRDPWSFRSEENKSGKDGGKSAPPSYMPKVSSDRFSGGNDRSTAPWQGNGQGASADRTSNRDSFGRPADNNRRPADASAANPLRGAEGGPAPNADTASRWDSAANNSTGSRPAAASRFNSDTTSRSGNSDVGAASPSRFANSAGVAPRFNDRNDAPMTPNTTSGRREDGAYVVGPTENYWSISEKLYGTGTYFEALAKHNSKKYPKEDKLKPGSVIQTPSQAELVRLYPSLCPKAAVEEALRASQSAASARMAPAGTAPAGIAPATAGTSAFPSSGSRLYVVREGETLYDIARYELGKASRWAEIYNLNRNTLGQQFDELTPGMRLVMPGSDTSELTQRPGSSYQR